MIAKRTAAFFVPLILFLATTLSASALTDAEIERLKMIGIFNLGDALWAVFAALLLLAIAVLVVGLKIANALSKRRDD